MRTLARLIVLIVVAGLLAIVAAVWFALAGQPLVTGEQRFSAADVAHAERLIRANDPRRLPSGKRGTLRLSGDDLNLLVGYLIHRTTGANGRVELARNALELQATRTLSRLPLRQHLNIEIGLVAADQRLGVSAFRVGDLRIPTPLIEWVGGRLAAMLLTGEQLQLTLASIEAVELGPDGLRLAYTWHPGVIDEATDTLLAAMDRNALRHYHDRLVALQRGGVGQRGSLTEVLQPLFQDARERSVDRDATTENAALISVLGAWASRGLERLVPGEIERPGAFRLTLRGRRDFAKHFVISAALSARGDSTLSNAVGLVKEIIDTDRGSGFSFTDIAADLAGSRFGELAVDPATSRGIQSALAGGTVDQDLMPPVDDLPEYMNSAEFKSRFQRVGSPSYEAMMAEIRRRLAGLALYR